MHTVLHASTCIPLYTSVNDSMHPVAAINAQPNTVQSPKCMCNAHAPSTTAQPHADGAVVSQACNERLEPYASVLLRTCPQSTTLAAQYTKNRWQSAPATSHNVCCTGSRALPSAQLQTFLIHGGLLHNAGKAHTLCMSHTKTVSMQRNTVHRSGKCNIHS
jgi:hypothetical protein